MDQNQPDLSRLNQCGWNSFDMKLFLNEAGRKRREVGPFFLSLLQDFRKGRQVLELASGCGKLAITLAQNNYHVVGVELSPEMIAISRQEAGKEPPAVQERIQIVHGDMCEFELGRKFDLVLLEDECFALLLSTEDQIACLNCVRDHLHADGLAFINLNTPELDLDSGQYEYDPIKQVKKEEYQWDVVDNGGQVPLSVETHRAPWFAHAICRAY